MPYQGKHALDRWSKGVTTGSKSRIREVVGTATRDSAAPDIPKFQGLVIPNRCKDIGLQPHHVLVARGDVRPTEEQGLPPTVCGPLSPGAKFTLRATFWHLDTPFTPQYSVSSACTCMSLSLGLPNVIVMFVCIDSTMGMGC